MIFFWGGGFDFAAKTALTSYEYVDIAMENLVAIHISKVPCDNLFSRAGAT